MFVTSALWNQSFMIIVKYVFQNFVANNGNLATVFEPRYMCVFVPFTKVRQHYLHRRSLCITWLYRSVLVEICVLVSLTADSNGI